MSDWSAGLLVTVPVSASWLTSYSSGDKDGITLLSSAACVILFYYNLVSVLILENAHLTYQYNLICTYAYVVANNAKYPRWKTR